MDVTRFECPSRLRHAVLTGVVIVSVGQFATIAKSYADIPKSQSAAASSNNAEVNRLLKEATKALRAGQSDLAIIQLKNAVQLAPNNGAVRAQLGIALLSSGHSDTAEQQLHQAMVDGAPRQIVVPPLLQAMLIRNEVRALLDEFPDPGANSKDVVAADILRARAMAYASFRRMADANSAMDRALTLRRDTTNLLGRAQLARQENDVALAGKLLDEALKKTPNDIYALLFKIELLRHRDDNQALAVANQFLSLYPGNLAGKWALVEVYEDLGRDQDAMNVVNGVLSKSPGLNAATYYKAAILAHKKDLRGAWLVAQSLPPEFVQGDPNVALSVAAIAEASGNRESAGAILALLVNNHPENATARLRLAALRLEQNSDDDALSILAPLADAKDPRAFALMAQADLREGRNSDALDALEKADASGSGNELLQKQLALAELNFGKADQGLQDLENLAAKEPGRVDLSGPLIVGLIRANRLDDALSAVARMEKAAPKSPYPPFYRGQILSAQKDTNGAIAAYGAAIQMDPKFVPALFYRAVAEQATGHSDAANRDLDRILAVDPTNAQALVEKAGILSSQNDDPQVLDLLNGAIAKSPKSNLPRLALANFLILRHRFPEAQAAIGAWLKALPDDPEALARLGQVQILLGKKQDAIATYQKLAAKVPKSPSAQMLLAAALATNGDAAGAKAAGTKAIQLSPDSVQLRAALVSIEANLGDADGALSTAKDFQSSHPGPDSDLLVAQTLLRLKRTDAAVEALKASFNAKPDRRVLLLLCEAEQSSGNSKSALARASDWLQKNPNDVAFLRFRANALLATGQQDAARADFEAVLRKSSNDAVTLNNLAWIIKDKDPKRAIALATKASQLVPESAEIMDTLGWLQFLQGQTKAALDMLQRARAKGAANPEIGYHLALALNASGQKEQAKSLLQAVLSSNPDFADASEAKKVLAGW